MAVKAVGRPSENQDDDYDSPAVCKIHVENIAATNYEKAPTTVIPIKNREVKALMDTDGVPPRRMLPDKQALVDAEVDEMRRNGIVIPVEEFGRGIPCRLIRQGSNSEQPLLQVW
jgi:hypothetical protein